MARFIPENARCCDIGTGAGLPGIPLAIVRSDLMMNLVEATKKKSRFLNHAVQELGLANCFVLGERSEALLPLDCDVVLSRLTGPAAKVLPEFVHHLKTDGVVVLYKTPAGKEVLPASLLKRLQLVVSGTADLTLPISGVPRRFVFLRRG